MLSPVIVFAYNRPEHLRHTLEALEQNALVEDTELFIFCDGAKGEKDRQKVKETREVIESFLADNRFKQVKTIFHNKNEGLANSVIAGVSQVLQEFETVIVLEDDIVTAPNFLRYMNDCLIYYEKDKRVGAISAYTPRFRISKRYPYDVFLSKRGNSWGWATWKKIWEDTDWDVSDFETFSQSRKRKKAFAATQYRAVEMLYEQMQGEIDSWAIRWDYSFFVRGLYTVYPIKTKICNIGQDGSGTHEVDEGQKDIDLKENGYDLRELPVDKRMIRASSENSQYIIGFIQDIIWRIKRLWLR